jgi:hypothetical protein
MPKLERPHTFQFVVLKSVSRRNDASEVTAVYAIRKSTRFAGFLESDAMLTIKYLPTSFKTSVDVYQPTRRNIPHLLNLQQDEILELGVTKLLS